MRMCHRNIQHFWYAPYDSTVEDEYGNHVSSYATYGAVVETYGNISAARGEVAARQFGDIENYDKVIVVDDRDTPIDEYTVLWIDTDAPVTDLDGKPQIVNGKYVTPWDYVVVRVGRGLPGFGGAVIAVRKVNVA